MAEIDFYNITRAGNFSADAVTANGTTEVAPINVVEGPRVADGVMYYGHVHTYTDGTYLFTLQDSDGNAVWDDVDDDLMLPNGGVVPISGNAAWRMGYIGKKQHARVKIVATDVTTGAEMAIHAVLLAFSHNPPGDQPA